MNCVDFITDIHKSTSRDYVGRVMEADKSECSIIAKKYGYDYWDGERKFGYGGYRYDGRWRKVARRMIDYYNILPGDSILDVGCGMAHLLFEFTKLIPDIQITGLDISDYALEHAKEEVRERLLKGDAKKLPFSSNSFDLVISINTLHNLKVYDLKCAIQEIERVSKKNSYIVVESYRNDKEEMNLLYWQLTCASYYAVDEWEWLFDEWGYTGDYSFIFFE